MKTQENDKTRLIKHLRALGHIGKACEAAEVSRRSYYYWVEKDKNFKALSRNALAHYMLGDV